MQMNQAFDPEAASLRDTLFEIQDEVSRKIVPDDVNKFDEASVFSNMLIDKLIEQGAIVEPAENSSLSYLSQHPFRARIGNREIDVWGSALMEDDQNRFSLNLFVCDYMKRLDVELIDKAEVSKLMNKALNFYLEGAKNLSEKMSPMHSAYVPAKRIRSAADGIDSVKIWLFTNRRFDNHLSSGRAGKKPDDKIRTEISYSVYDIKKIQELLNGGIRITMSFDTIGGIAVYHSPTKSGEYKCMLTSFAGSRLSELYSMHGTSLIQANVRAYLGDNKVNKKIMETIRNEPEKFFAYNNGLVIVADKAEFNNEGKLTLLDGVQIINGGQTTASIYHCWLREQNSRTLGSRTVAENLNSVFVPVKIVIPNEEIGEYEKNLLIEKISEAANSQTAVKGSDLSANTPFQRSLHDAVMRLSSPKGGDWFYERARGLYKAELGKRTGSISEKKSFQEKYPASKKVEKTDIAISHLAWKSAAAACAKGKEIAFASLDQQTESITEVSPQLAKQLLSEWIVFKALEDRMKKSAMKNPRVPVLYAIAMFKTKYSVDWNKIWTKQEPSQALLNVLVQITIKVQKIINETKGDFMIAMWGRNPRCMATLQQMFTFDGIDMTNIPELIEL